MIAADIVTDKHGAVDAGKNISFGRRMLFVGSTAGKCFLSIFGRIFATPENILFRGDRFKCSLSKCVGLKSLPLWYRCCYCCCVEAQLDRNTGPLPVKGPHFLMKSSACCSRWPATSQRVTANLPRFPLRLYVRDGPVSRFRTTVAVP
ncbi:unnamed protein product [Scytosiphon promiscuus]